MTVFSTRQCIYPTYNGGERSKPSRHQNDLAGNSCLAIVFFYGSCLCRAIAAMGCELIRQALEGSRCEYLNG
jgi:hypothetical protein